MVKPNGLIEIKNTKFGADVFLNGNQLFVLEDGLTIDSPVGGMPVVTMTIAVETIMIQDRKD